MDGDARAPMRATRRVHGVHSLESGAERDVSSVSIRIDMRPSADADIDDAVSKGA
jgi:hypothetical protein